MSHSARGGAKGQRKGRNAPSNVSPPIPPNTSSSTPLAIAPFAASGAHASLNPILARQQAQEKKTPFVEVCDKERRAWRKARWGRQCVLDLQFLQ